MFRDSQKKYVRRLILGDVSIDDLTITRVLSMSPEEYSTRVRYVIAAKKLERLGVSVEPGQAVTYVLSKSGASIIQTTSENEYDLEAYLKVLNDAAKTVLTPILAFEMDSSR